MRFLIFIVLSVFISNAVYSQSAKDTIVVDYAFWGNDYYIDGIEFSRGDICSILETNIKSRELMNVSYNEKYWGYATLSAGIILVGYSLIDIYISYNNYQ